MRLVVDSKIPYIRGFAERLGEVQYVNGAEISADDVRQADALIVRTRTRCNAQLLTGSSVKFIATATIGYDHLDTDFLKKAGIAWTNCPGCNTNSVAQYIKSALLLLASHGAFRFDVPMQPAFAPCSAELAPADFLPFAGLTLGIVGVGHVGTEVERMARALGFTRILLCDPPRAAREGRARFVPPAVLAREADIITFHTPLTTSPTPYPTYHLADASFFEKVRNTAVVINASRGEVVDTEALLCALGEKKIRAAVVDTWENEPHIARPLLDKVFIGTPHIAGYSADGKATGSRMALQAVARFFGKDEAIYNKVLPPTLPSNFVYFPEAFAHYTALPATCRKVYTEALRLYDPSRDFLALRNNPTDFEKIRGNYPLRREA